jgi:pimeloyl-ACP methyl ester carboxylesterase
MSSRNWTSLVAVVVVVGLLIGLAVPWNVGGLSSHPQPVLDYAAARPQALRTSEQATLNPDCLVQFMTHGQKMPRVVVFVHAYTTCPQQFSQLGRNFFAAGYNVVIAPLPHHGLADRLTDEQSQLTAEELAAYADDMVNLAHALGQQVVMVGISGGGVVTAWAAQHLGVLDLAAVISPAFGFKQIPTALTAAAMNLISILPESYAWWDPALEGNIGPSYAYPRYSRHGLIQIMRLGFSVQAAAQHSPPASRRILVVLNGAEPSVNNELAQQVAQSWRQHGANVTTFEFPASLGLPHDLIDPSQPAQQADLVYPELTRLISP